MSAARSFEIAPPPRHVPASVVVSVLFGGWRSQLGWGFVVGTGIFCWIFLLNSDFASWYYFRGEVASVSGRVTGIEKTKFSEGGTSRRHSSRRDGRPIYAIHYQYTVGGVDRSGTSFKAASSYSSEPKVGPDVVVEYPPDRPDISRIEGLRRKPFTGWLGLIGVLIPVGPVMALMGFASGLRAWGLLRRGQPTLARLIDRRPTNATINKQKVYALTFAYQSDDGGQFETIVKTHETDALEDEAAERLLYDPAQPSRAVLLDSLPGTPGLDAAGGIQPNSAGRTLATATLPVIALLGAAACIAMQWTSP